MQSKKFGSKVEDFVFLTTRLTRFVESPISPVRSLTSLLLCFVVTSSLTVFSQTSGPDVEQRINALLARMTLEEKLGQLQQLDGEANGNYRPEHLDLVRKGLL